MLTVTPLSLNEFSQYYDVISTQLNGLLYVIIALAALGTAFNRWQVQDTAHRRYVGVLVAALVCVCALLSWFQGGAPTPMQLTMNVAHAAAWCYQVVKTESRNRFILQHREDVSRLRKQMVRGKFERSYRHRSA